MVDISSFGLTYFENVRGEKEEQIPFSQPLHQFCEIPEPIVG
jgi:hypothetical protein